MKQEKSPLFPYKSINLMHMKQCILSLLIFLFQCSIQAQICDGNLGENIFEEGDFGSGVANVLQTNPLIAPGYTYTLNPPPFDGLYTLTNNTGAWTGNFGTWLDIPDNSPDPQGYMMVVNASFEPGLFYEQEVAGLCENTLYEFSSDVINLIRIEVPDHIAPNVSFLIDGVVNYTTGNIPQSELWNSYGFTFVTEPGQTTVVLSLQNNAPGGIGNDLAIDNITFRPCGPLAQILPEEIESICEDGQPATLVATITGNQYDTPAFQWQESFDQGLTWSDIPGANMSTFLHTNLSSGFYYYRYLLANDLSNLANSKCRVNSNVKIVEVVPKFWSIVDTLCEGLTYFSGNAEYTETGIYVDSLISSIGCDSIVTQDLTFISDAGITVVVTTVDPLCFGEATGSISIENIMNADPPFSFFINGTSTNGDSLVSNLEAGIYEVSIIDVFGCRLETIADIVAPEEFTIGVGADQSVQLGEEVSIDPFSNYTLSSFTWTPEVAGCEPGCLDFDFFPTVSQTYTLNAVSEIGCQATDDIYIEVEDVRKVFIPNIFSPNFDGTNDYFTVFADTPNVLSIQSLRVFNRWGALVFEQFDFQPNQISAGWDGTFKNKEVDTGVYVYLIEVLFLDGKVISYAGDVALVR
ncbi:MAG: gliding motility-associated-like protein [Saprospiraceae bacterium]|jgi:gliding motility-associated-like protein